MEWGAILPSSEIQRTEFGLQSSPVQNLSLSPSLSSSDSILDGFTNRIVSEALWQWLTEKLKGLPFFRLSNSISSLIPG